MNVGEKCRHKICEFERIDSNTVRKKYLAGRDGWTAEELCGNEIAALNKVRGFGAVQQIKGYGANYIETEYAGEPLSPDNFSTLFTSKAQGEDILGVLAGAGITHRDIRPDNLMVHNGEMTLIDFAWADFEGSVLRDSARTLPSALGGNFKAGGEFNDHYSMAMSLATTKFKSEVAEIKEMIAQIGSSDYRDGSSSKAGHTYQPIPFHDFADVPTQKRSIEAEWEAISKCIEDKKLPAAVALDIGSNIGFIPFSFWKQWPTIVVGVEADPDNVRVAQALANLYDASNQVRFLYGDAYGILDDIPPGFDLAVCLNVHMWIHKQRGMDGAIDFMRRLAKKTRHLFFQTSHAESGGKHIIKELPDKDAIMVHLQDCGYKDIELIHTTNEHGGVRYLFYAAV